MGIKHLGFQCTCFGSTYTKIGTIQRRLAWPLRKDDTQNREAFHIFRAASLQQYIGANQNLGLLTLCAAGVVVSCKIPILATRVRFPGGAKTYIAFFKHEYSNYSIIKLNTLSNRGMQLSGRAFALHVKGPGFDPRHLHFYCKNTVIVLVSFSQSLHSFCFTLTKSASACANLLEVSQRAPKIPPFLSTAIPC